MMARQILIAGALTLGVTTASHGATIQSSPYFFNKKADFKAVELEGGSTSSAKWAVATPSRYQVFVTIPANATATAATYRIYPNGSAASDNSCTIAQKSKPCYEITIDQSASQGKEVQLTTDKATTWNFTSNGYVSVVATTSAADEILGIGNVRFTELPKAASFSKIANNGSRVSDDAALGVEATNWACTKDNKTGLIWEAKPSDSSLFSRTYTYSWYNPDMRKNGGFAGSPNLGKCVDGVACDTDGYIKAVNTAKLCGYSDWRLPNVKEYMNIVDPSFIDYSIYSGALNPTYFPGTATFDRYWTSETTDENNTQANFVILTGTYGFSPKADGQDFRVRLVRGN